MDNKIDNDEKIIGVVGQLRRYARFWIRDWLAGITDKGNVLFISTYQPPAGPSGEATLITKTDLQGKPVVRLMSLPNRQVFFTAAEFAKINIQRNLFRQDRILFSLGVDQIKLLTWRKQLNILDGVINKKEPFEKALETSGPDYSRIKYLALAAIALLLFFIFYLTRFIDLIPTRPV
jgi:hypothetical protein